ncbi:MAG: ATP-binding domain-containing protein, partial [Atopobium sp.]|nr:ATP-binding domain-containing protein [Atopobium sp.]
HEVIESASWLRIDRIGMRMLNTSALSGAECVYLRLLITGAGEKNVKFVMIDEVQDYTETQLMVLGKYFSRAHFLLLGDSNQAIWEDTATFEQIEKIFTATHGEDAVSTCKLLTSYRSSPEITALFTSLLSEEERGQTSSVQRGGKKPEFFEVVAEDKDTERAEYLQTMKSLVEQAQAFDGLTAIVCTEKSRVRWLAKQLEGLFVESDDADGVKVLTSHDSLPAKGVVLLDLALAKGLEFDQVIVADAQEEVYKADGISRRRLYTALSRAMHHVIVVSQGKMTPLLSKLL